MAGGEPMTVLDGLDQPDRLIVDTRGELLAWVEDRAQLRTAPAAAPMKPPRPPARLTPPSATAAMALTVMLAPMLGSPEPMSAVMATAATSAIRRSRLCSTPSEKDT